LTRRKVLRVVLLAGGALSFVYAVFVWWNINGDLSSENFSEDTIDFARYVWIEVNLMLIALAVSAVALLIAWRQT
jgi:hypothetical protein